MINSRYINMYRLSALHANKYHWDESDQVKSHCQRILGCVWGQKKSHSLRGDLSNLLYWLKAWQLTSVSFQLASANTWISCDLDVTRASQQIRPHFVKFRTQITPNMNSNDGFLCQVTRRWQYFKVLDSANINKLS